MRSFNWNENFVTGFGSVDSQHKELVSLINELGNQLVEDRFDPQRADELIQKLVDYAHYHFREEEALMLEVGIDARHLNHHIEEHQYFLREVCTLKDASNTEVSATYMLKFLTHWLAYHILGQDQNMARQLELIQAGVAANAAFEHQQRNENPATATLVDAIGCLFKQVSTRNRELQELNLTLEEKVNQRTQELLKANTHLEELSLTDTLTQLPNRRHGMQTLARLWQEGEATGQPVSVMLVDADYFKLVNDNYGHAIGDKVLKELARTLEGALRTDDMVCRLGGDEFLVLCPNTDEQGAKFLAEQLVAKVDSLKVETGASPWRGSISLGFATQQPKGDQSESLIRRADRGVYAAKVAGRGCARSVNISGE
ncbi:GGDEF domain-containing protein [Ferrimonas aestuarii]|uniref:diguanylate cyclase n=1 Tax=Ferrimonas aestuarii TaxID=2569539 RepID=A0A4U1BRJ4_9GAMM|nr:GGDEF domain-containing protein [Ferrimonas aestuarii]TKB56788.1 GGDEF domain-containing protein [Ferrimonas aestuarii]